MWKRTALALLFLLVLPVPRAEAEQADPAVAVLEKAEALFDEGNAQDAVKAFKKARKAAAQPSYRCAIGLARSFNNLGDFKDAEAGAREALALAATPIEEAAAYSQIGIALYARGTAGPEGLRKAEEALRKVFEASDATIQGTRFLLGLVLLKQERDEEGVAVLREYLELEPEGRFGDRARELIDNPLRARVDLVPDFELVTLDGRRLTSAQLAGKVVLLDFWGTWCKPCVASIPHLRRLNRRSEMDPFVILSIASDSDESLLRTFVSENEMTWPQFFDQDRQVTNETFQVASFPTYVVVDHEGVMIYRRSGWSESIAAEVEARVSRAIRAAKKAAR
jgi:thiol-disulfide isomerase/thioredoxin